MTYLGRSENITYETRFKVLGFLYVIILTMLSDKNTKCPYHKIYFIRNVLHSLVFLKTCEKDIKLFTWNQSWSGTYPYHFYWKILFNIIVINLITFILYYLFIINWIKRTQILF